MQTTSNPKIPKDIEELKRSWWSINTRFRMIQADNMKLREQLSLYEKTFNLVDGYFSTIKDKRKCPELNELPARIMQAITEAKAEGIRHTEGYTKVRHSKEKIV